MRTHRLPLLALLFTLSCGTPPPSRDAGTQPGPAPTGSGVVVANPAHEPVAVPANIIAKARLSNLSTTARKLAGTVGLPSQALDNAGRALVVELLGRKGARLDVDGKALASVVRTDAPVDLVVALHADRPEPLFVVSIPVSSLDEARTAAGEAAIDRGAGIVGLAGKRARGSCQIMNSAGVATARLVCGASDLDLETLAPYAVRNLAADNTVTSDLSAEIDVRALDAKFGKELRTVLPSLPTLIARRYGGGLLGSALGDGGRVLGEEAGKLLSDLDRVNLDLRVGEDIALDMKASFRGETSFVAKSSFAQPAGPAPAMFWKGPADAASGSFTTLGDPAAYAELISAAKAMVTGLMTEMKIGNEAERNKVAALFDFPIKNGMVVASYSGSDYLSPPPAPKSSKEKWQRAFAEISGWSMTATSDSPEAMIKWAKSAVEVFNSPGIQKALKAGIGKDASIIVKNAKAPASLGKTAHLVELRMQSTTEKSDATMFILISGTPSGAAILSGFDLVDLTARAVLAQQGKSELARAELAILRDKPSSSSFFFSVGSFRSMMLSWFMLAPTGAKPEDEMLAMTARANGLFTELPSKGKAPMFLMAGANKTDRTMTASLKLPKPALNEVAALVKKVAR